MKILDARTAEQWRRWLADHHDSESAVWLVFHKRHTGRASIAYEDAVDEALCFGWVDSLNQAWCYFESLAPSHRRMYIGWIDSAKGPRRNKYADLAVEAPGWQGARSAHIGNMEATSNAASRDASAARSA